MLVCVDLLYNQYPFMKKKLSNKAPPVCAAPSRSHPVVLILPEPGTQECQSASWSLSLEGLINIKKHATCCALGKRTCNIGAMLLMIFSMS